MTNSSKFFIPKVHSNTILLGFILITLWTFTWTMSSAQEKILLIDTGSNLCYATSELGNDKLLYPNQYGISNVFDQDLSTAYVEGNDDYGSETSLYFVLPEHTDSISIFNGYGKNRERFKQNNRIRELVLSFYVGVHYEGHATETALEYQIYPYPKTYPLALNDTFAFQKKNLAVSSDRLTHFKDSISYLVKDKPVNDISYILKMNLKNVYKGTKWDDTCISEIRFHCKSRDTISRYTYETIRAVFTDSSQHTIFIQTEGNDRLEIHSDTNLVYQIIQTSPRKRWAIVISMPAEAGPGRTETTYHLFHLTGGREVDLSSFRENIWMLYGFVQKGQTLYLETDAGLFSMEEIKSSIPEENP